MSSSVQQEQLPSTGSREAGTSGDSRADWPVLLIVDDDESVRRSFRRLASILHMTSIEAADGFQALRILREANVDVILCDVQMPGLTGAGVYHALPAPLQERLLLLSGHPTRPLVPERVQLLQKPVPLPMLESAIQAILDR